MNERYPKRTRHEGWSREGWEFRDLSSAILHQAMQGYSRTNFIRGVTRLLLQNSGCDALELRLREGSDRGHWQARRGAGNRVLFQVLPTTECGEEEAKKQDLLEGPLVAPPAFLTPRGSFYTANAQKTKRANYSAMPRAESGRGGPFLSLVYIPFQVGDMGKGLVGLKWKRPNAITREQVEFFESVAVVLGSAVVNHRTVAAQGERVKELTCVYGLARALERSDLGLDEILQEIVELLPPAWQYPEITCGRIILDDRSFLTRNFRGGPYAQVAEIRVRAETRGKVEVIYTQPRLPSDEGPFLKEERELLNVVASEVGRLIEKRETEEERIQLQKHLRHADRLATIGQLSAGFAHEINEPLGSILGFAQLSRKQEGMPPQSIKDLDKIIAAALHAREVIRKLMLFARVQHPRQEWVNLNQIVEQGLSLLEARASENGINITRRLAPDLPAIMADPTQMQQVLVNLVVNAIQAMPKGGALTMETFSRDREVFLSVQDKGTGMSRKVMEQIFDPFFTTKEVGEGTGLGLAVVHGIVTTHGGSIHVQSGVGQGSRFEVRLPLSSRQAQETDSPR
jgi:signal transduction histidine kinase